MEWVALAAAVIAAAAALLARRRPSPAQARVLFRRDAGRLAETFRSAAAATGKPRGLVWVECRLDGEPLLARDAATGELVGLVPATVRFEAVPGSDMEGLPAVGNLREATAVFRFAGGRWATDGRAVFNLAPAEALARMGDRYRAVPG